MLRVSVAHFGHCVLDQNKREFRVRGSVQPLAPRVFDVLAYLINHRDRVIRKEELIDNVWAGAFVTDGALARSVSKARLAIGDSADQPRFIKTVERVGYLFVGEVADSEAPAAPSSEGILAPAREDALFPMRVSLLPFVNELADPQFAWVDLGLKSLVRHALERDRRLDFTPTVDVLRVLETLAEDAPAADTATAVQRALNVHLVLVCTVSKLPHGFRLSYTGYGPRAHGLNGEIEGDELTQLGQKLADAVELSIDAEDNRAAPLAFPDPFTDQALARALEAQTLQRHARAAMYFRIVMELEPANHQVRLAAARSIMAVDCDDAIRICRELVADLADSADMLSRAAAHHSLGEALWQRSADEEAEFHIKEALRVKEALRLTGGCEADSLLMMRIHALNATASIRAGDIAAYEHHSAVVRSVALKTGSEDALCWALGSQSLVDLWAGRFDPARRHIDESLALARKLNRPADECNLLSALAELQWAQGCQRDAIVTCNELIVQLARCPHPLTTADQAFNAALICRQTGRIGDLQQLVDIGAVIWPKSELRFIAALVGTKALLASARGDVPACIALWREAADRSLRSRDFLKLGQFLWLLGMELLRSGTPAEAEAIANDMVALPSHAMHPVQQQSASHLRAAVLHASGRASEANERLRELCINAPANLAGSLARLDASWLFAEHGHLDCVEAGLDDLQQWTTSHPLGLAVCARYQYARGRHAEACRLHALCLTFYEGREVPLWLRQVGEAYASGAPCPALARLPSVM